MNVIPGGSAGGDPDPDLDLDLDRPAADEAPIVALFRTGLGTERRFTQPQLQLIEARARLRQRRRRAAVYGAGAAAGMLVAVAVLASPWLPAGTDRGTPSAPSPSSAPNVSVVPTAAPSPSAGSPTPQRSPTMSPQVTAAEFGDPEVTEDSLLVRSDLTDGGSWSALGGEMFDAAGPAEDLSGQELVGGVCGEDVLSGQTPERSWRRSWQTDTRRASARYSMTEQIAQWPGRPEQAQQALTDLRAQVEDCGGSTDRTGDQDWSVPHLTVVATGTDYRPYAQVFVVWQSTLVIIQVELPSTVDDPDNPKGPHGNEDGAVLMAAAIADTAVGRLLGQLQDGGWSGLSSVQVDAGESRSATASRGVDQQ